MDLLFFMQKMCFWVKLLVKLILLSFVDRFVRFVSTPAVLERFVSLEKEIQQIEGQFQANALSMSVTIPDEGMYG
jgi:hypothetical protein